MSDKEILTKEPLKDAPTRDAAGRTLTAERVIEKAEEGAPEEVSVVVEVPGITVRADDSDGEGLARAQATLAAMVSDA